MQMDDIAGITRSGRDPDLRAPSPPETPCLQEHPAEMRSAAGRPPAVLRPGRGCGRDNREVGRDEFRQGELLSGASVEPHPIPPSRVRFSVVSLIVGVPISNGDQPTERSGRINPYGLAADHSKVLPFSKPLAKILP